MLINTQVRVHNSSSGKLQVGKGGLPPLTVAKHKIEEGPTRRETISADGVVCCDNERNSIPRPARNATAAMRREREDFRARLGPAFPLSGNPGSLARADQRWSSRYFRAETQN